MASFVLRKLDPTFWSCVQAQAAAEQLTIKALILRLLAQRLGVVALALLPIACGYTAPAAPTPVTPIANTVPYALNLNAGTGAATMTVTASVQNISGTMMPGVVVGFTTDAGTLSATSVMTGANGQAVTTVANTVSSTVTANAGTLSTRIQVVAPLTVTAPTPTPSVPAPIVPTPPAPLTVTLLSIPRQAGTSSDFSLATTTISSATWTFGDSSSSVTTSTPFVSHTYTAAGTFQAGVTVVDTLGRVASATATVSIPAPTPAPTPPAAPFFNASVACTTSTTTLVVACNATAIANGSVVPSAKVMVDWDWGDSMTGGPSGATAAHTYPNPGTYTIYADVSGTVDGHFYITHTTVAVTVPAASK